MGVCGRQQPASAEEGFSIHRPGSSQNNGPAQLGGWKQTAGRVFLVQFTLGCSHGPVAKRAAAAKRPAAVGKVPGVGLRLEEGTVCRRPFLT